MPVRILLVDDHQLLRDGLRLSLQQRPEFMVVGEASTAREACLRASELAPDVVIVDINLPDESGVAAAAKIRATDPRIQIIALTGASNTAIAHDALLAGANAFVKKEDGADELVRAIHVVMSGKVYLCPDAATTIAQSLRDNSGANASQKSPLTRQEIAVLKGFANGLSYKEIAAEMQLSVKSVETYRSRLVKKLHGASKADLVRYAVRQGLVAP